MAANTPASGSGVWTISSGTGTITTPSDPATTVTGVTPGSSTVLKWTITSGTCTDFDEVTVTNYENVSAANAGPDQSGCSTSIFTLAANTPSVGTGTWSVVSGPSTSASQFDNTASSTATFTPAGGLGTYTLQWSITNGDCASTDEVDIVVNSGSCCPTPGTVWYVDASAPSGGTGTSWACAFDKLQDAIDASSSGQEIWVKAGLYLPTKDPFGNASPADPRDKVFYLKNGVAIYGGFAGTETMRTQRNWTANSTTLSGDIGTASVNSDNSYHVVLSVNDDNTTVLDGFTIMDAYTDGSGSISVESRSISRTRGAGIYSYFSSLTINNCTISGNTIPSGNGVGAGMYCSFGTPTVNNCMFSGNSTTDRGGGMYNSYVSNMSISNCTFTNNTSLYGGGAYNSNSTLTFTSCSFLSNTASISGGGMRNETSTFVTVVDGVFAGNSATSTNGGGFYIGTSSTGAVLTNCLITGNSSGGTGAGIYNSGTPTATFTNCTISG
ncbi:MAG: right-handed parallel beta-helix repeat-containing protein, partial [Bacteroidetes bacterium]